MPAEGTVVVRIAEVGHRIAVVEHRTGAVRRRSSLGSTCSEVSLEDDVSCDSGRKVFANWTYSWDSDFRWRVYIRDYDVVGLSQVRYVGTIRRENVENRKLMIYWQRQPSHEGRRSGG